MESNVTRNDIFDRLHFCAGFCGEKKKGAGEDRGIWGMAGDRRQGVYIGVFDGCGGSGAKQYTKYGNRTGAYMAAEAASSVFKSWFAGPYFRSGGDEEELKKALLSGLNRLQTLYGEDTLVRGMMSKRFPTTAAAAICTPAQAGAYALDCYWAGDSRVYMLDARGLAQLTADDLSDVDAMENLTEDSPLTNQINLTTDFTIHKNRVVFREPGIVFAATDGCFGYLSTPMEFEYLLLGTLQKADSHGEWIQRVRSAVEHFAGDDYTFSAFALGFDTWLSLKRAFSPRTACVLNQYIRPAREMSLQEKTRLWLQYKPNYSRMLPALEG